MKKHIFDKSKYSVWYVFENGDVYCDTKYQGRNSVHRLRKHNHMRGYQYVRTTNGNYQVHRLVAEAFAPNPKNKPCVNHKDCNKHNNVASNLEWVTHKENNEHARANGRVTLLNKNCGAKLKYSNAVCADVLRRVSSGMTYVNAGSKYNMPYSTVAHLVRGSRRLIKI